MAALQVIVMLLSLHVSGPHVRYLLDPSCLQFQPTNYDIPFFFFLVSSVWSTMQYHQMINQYSCKNEVVSVQLWNCTMKLQDSQGWLWQVPNPAVPKGSTQAGVESLPMATTLSSSFRCIRNVGWVHVDLLDFRPSLLYLPRMVLDQLGVEGTRVRKVHRKWNSGVWGLFWEWVEMLEVSVLLPFLLPVVLTLFATGSSPMSHPPLCLLCPTSGPWQESLSPSPASPWLLFHAVFPSFSLSIPSCFPQPLPGTWHVGSQPASFIVPGCLSSAPSTPLLFPTPYCTNLGSVCACICISADCKDWFNFMGVISFKKSLSEQQPDESLIKHIFLR